MYACERGKRAIVKYLVEQGADINKENRYAKTPLIYAQERGKEKNRKYLVKEGAKRNKKTRYIQTKLF